MEVGAWNFGLRRKERGEFGYGKKLGFWHAKIERERA